MKMYFDTSDGGGMHIASQRIVAVSGPCKSINTGYEGMIRFLYVDGCRYPFEIPDDANNVLQAMTALENQG